MALGLALPGTRGHRRVLPPGGADTLIYICVLIYGGNG
jgi:hypothetical protein